MCGRFALDASVADLEGYFGADGQGVGQLPADWNISPTKQTYFVKGEDGAGQARTLGVSSWGLIPSWAKDGSRASNAINARVESIDAKPTFATAFRRYRCLIPATGYYEWATELGRYKPKQPFYISNSDGSLMAMAGIFDYWASPESGKAVMSTAIITREAVGLLAPIHHRSPIFLPRDRWGDWLSTDVVSDVSKLFTILDVEPSGIEARPVSDAVNSARNAGPTLIEGIELGEPETLF